MATEALADALIQDLQREVPGPGAHPNATGNLLSALTERSGVLITGHVWWVGVGNMNRLGLPGERKYRPRPIKRFLDWYLEREESAHEERRQRQQETAAARAARAKQRDEERKQRVVVARGEEQELWRRIATRRAEVEINAIAREAQKIIRAIERMDSALINYSVYFERAEAKGWDLTKRSYQFKRQKWSRLAKRKADAQERLSELDQRIGRLEEGVMRFNAGYQ